MGRGGTAAQHTEGLAWTRGAAAADGAADGQASGIVRRGVVGRRRVGDGEVWWGRVRQRMRVRGRGRARRIRVWVGRMGVWGIGRRGRRDVARMGLDIDVDRHEGSRQGCGSRLKQLGTQAPVAGGKGGKRALG
ncbi:hypothetical protein FH972_023414 [Carpinus fangiana]|uniref:Uncharacterized protein n=1 Tax=Carpinus fangiana TaxID=176857 RepID=A0A5N6KVD2_9ROSI|nr:hypothetical protein FH972_023414 [Carpinus fangiana]